ncbi:MAG: hypothetical protein JXA33_01710 [Anaerolineae bacterium]|nr:hypothetical protein [Anaerolineae bacterium]
MPFIVHTAHHQRAVDVGFGLLDRIAKRGMAQEMLAVLPEVGQAFPIHRAGQGDAVFELGLDADVLPGDIAFVGIHQVFFDIDKGQTVGIAQRHHQVVAVNCPFQDFGRQAVDAAAEREAEIGQIQGRVPILAGRHTHGHTHHADHGVNQPDDGDDDPADHGDDADEEEEDVHHRPRERAREGGIELDAEKRHLVGDYHKSKEAKGYEQADDHTKDPGLRCRAFHHAHQGTRAGDQLADGVIALIDGFEDIVNLIREVHKRQGARNPRHEVPGTTNRNA